MKLILILETLLFSLNLHAVQVDVLGRLYLHSCGYFSNQTADLELYFQKPTLSTNATVSLIYGLGSRLQKRDWERRQQISTDKVGLSDVRVAKIVTPILHRGAPEIYDKIQFVWEIREANGSVSYDQGGMSTWGFYEVHLPVSGPIPCTEPGKQLPRYEKLSLLTIDRE